jgi:hypothetical protein
MAWTTRFATMKAPACAIVGIHGVNLSFTIRQSRMKQLRIPDPRRGQRSAAIPFPPGSRCTRFALYSIS